jgi:hypothetical protein
MLPLFNEEHGSSANSLAAMLMASPEMTKDLILIYMVLTYVKAYSTS